MTPKITLSTLFLLLIIAFWHTKTFAQTVNLGSDIASCTPPVVIGVTPELGINYVWENAAGGIVGFIVINGSYATVGQSGTYILTATDPITGSSATDQITVIMNTPPVVNLPPIQKLCTNGTPAVLSPTGSFGSSPVFQWYKNGVAIAGATSLSYTVANTLGNEGNYSVLVTKTEPPACFADASTVVTIEPAPIDVLKTDTLICATEGVIRTSPFLAGHTYAWRNKDTTSVGILSGVNTDTLKVNVSGKYFLKITNAAGCVRYDSIRVKLAKPAYVNLGGAYTVCNSKGNFTLRAKTAANLNKVKYQWYKNGVLIPSATKDSLQVYHPSQTYAYYAVITDTTGGYALCSTTTSIAEVTFKPAPTVVLSGHNAAVGTCALKDTLNLEVTNVLHYFTQWSGPGIIKYENDSLRVIVDKSGLYTIKVTDSLTKCDTSLFLNVIFNPTPTADLGSDKVFCTAQKAYKLFVKNPSHATGATYQWFKNGSTIAGASADSLSVFEIGTFEYSVKVTQPTGCFILDTVKITFNSEPKIFISGHDPLLGSCSQKVPLKVDGQVQGMNISWSFQTWDNIVLVNQSNFEVTQSGTYYVLVTNPLTSCFAKDSIRVTIHKQLFTKLPADTKLCENASLFLDAYHTSLNTANYNTAYEWKRLNLVNPSLSKVIDTTQTHLLTFADALSFDTQYYSVVVRDRKTGCTASDTIAVQFVRQPESNAGFDQAICLGESVNLRGTASKTRTYLWYKLVGSDIVVLSQKQTFTFKPTSTTTVYLRTDGDGICPFALDEVLITVNPLPKVRINISDFATRCIGDTIILSAEIENLVGTASDYQYIWETGEKTPSIIVFPEDTTTYRLRVIDKNGCMGTTEVTLLIATPIDMPDSLFACENETLKIGALSPNPIAQYAWSTGATTPFITVDSTAWYVLTLTIGECVYKDSVYTLFKPNPNITLRSDSVMCFEDETRQFERKKYLILPPLKDKDKTAKYFYKWEMDDVLLTRKDSLWIDKAGTYKITVTTDLGCVSTDTIRIVETCPPRIYLPDGFTPDGDGVNEFFSVFGAHIIKFEMEIINRWSETVYHKSAKIFEEVKETEWWDGTYRDTREECPTGLYFWTITYYSKLRPYYPIRIMGHTTLIR